MNRRTGRINRQPGRLFSLPAPMRRQPGRIVRQPAGLEQLGNTLSRVGECVQELSGAPPQTFRRPISFLTALALCMT